MEKVTIESAFVEMMQYTIDQMEQGKLVEIPESLDLFSESFIYHFRQNKNLLKSEELRVPLPEEEDIDIDTLLFRKSLEDLLYQLDSKVVSLWNSVVAYWDNVIQVKEFTPNKLDLLLTRVEHPTHVCISSGIWDCMLENAAFTEQFGALTKIDSLLSGCLGTWRKNIKISTDAFRDVVHQVLPINTAYVLGIPHKLGMYKPMKTIVTTDSIIQKFGVHMSPKPYTIAKLVLQKED